MPNIARITNTFFTALLDRLGVRPPFRDGFELSNVVTPISIVDSDVPISSVTTPPTVDSVNTQGIQLQPAAGTLLADSGALSQGTYFFRIIVGTDRNVAGGGCAEIQRRDSGNAANLYRILLPMSDSGIQFYDVLLQTKLATNERIRVVVTSPFTAGLSVLANIFRI
jgi:hypothetical protein